MDKTEILAELASRICNNRLMIAECDRIIARNKKSIERINKILKDGKT